MTDKQFEQIEYLSKKLWENINNGHEYSMVTYTEFLGIVTEVWERLQEESVSEDLGEYINELSKQFPEVSFAKLSRIAVRVAKWQKEQIMAKATDMVVGYWMPNGLMLTVDEAENCYNIDEGDRVKVIVIKEN